MHLSLMSGVGVRPEITRDNMGHADIDVTQNVYNKTWLEERVDAVSMAAAIVCGNYAHAASAFGNVNSISRQSCN